MSKKPRAREETPPTPEPTPADNAALAEIDATREQNAKPPKTSIYRVDPDTGDRKFVARVTPDLATEEIIQKRYGAGKYYLKHQIANASGQYVYNSADTITVDAATDDAGAGDETQQPAAGASSPAVAPPTTIERAMDAGVLGLLEAQARMSELSVAMVKRLVDSEPPQRGPDLVALITAASPIIVALLKDRRDPTEQLVTLATAMSKRDSGGEQMASMFERGIALATKYGAGGGGGGEGGMMPVVVGEGIRVLGSIIDNINAERRMARGEPVATVHPEPTAELGPRLVPDETPAPSMTPPPPGGDRLWIAAARPHLPMLLAAARFMPAGAAADTIAANLSPTALEDLLTDIEDPTPPGFAARLAAVFPQLEGINPEWFSEMIRELLEITSPEPEPAPARPPAKPAKAGRK